MMRADWKWHGCLSLIGLAFAATVAPVQAGTTGRAARQAWLKSFPVNKADLADQGREVEGLGSHLHAALRDPGDVQEAVDEPGEALGLPDGPAQAVDLRGGPDKLGRGSRTLYERVRAVSPFQERDRAMEQEVAMVAAQIAAGEMVS